MSTDTWLAFALFAFVSSITPGPNNTMLLASGVNFGFVRSLPHMAGVTVGFCLMILLMGLGLGSVFVRFPVLYTVLRYVGGTYMLYLAWKIFRSQPASPADNHAAAAKPMGFTAAAAFQWVNPKAWVMAVSAMATYTNAANYTMSVLIVGLAFAIVNFPSVSTWAGFGSALREWLSVPVRLKWFNITMALLLVASLWPMLR